MDQPALYVIATPIGNAADWSQRAIEVIRDLGALACEDTRRTQRILAIHGIDKPATMFSYHDHNEARAAGRVLGLLQAGVSVGLCSDAGTPGLSDPGYRAVRLAIDKGFAVLAVPGAHAAAAALSISGLPTSSYTFLGFPPRKSGQRQTFLGREADSRHTLVLYESPHRVGALLRDAASVLGDRQAAVCIELTKVYERVERGWLGDLAERFTEAKVKGEITVVIAGNNPKFRRTGQAGEDAAPAD